VRQAVDRTDNVGNRVEQRRPTLARPAGPSQALAYHIGFDNPRRLDSASIWATSASGNRTVKVFMPASCYAFDR
jgi:hypothetical protein